MMNQIKQSQLMARSCFAAGIVMTLVMVGCKPAGPAPQMGAPDVLVMDVVQKDVPIYGEWIGTLDGMVNAKINAQVSGYLKSQNYTEGDLVRKGDLLFQIDPRPFQATLDKSQGELNQAQANLDLTAINVKRYTPLAKDNAISQQELDDAIQSNKGAQAALETCQAAVQQAELNLEFTKITSPIDGIAGIAEAQVGDLVGPNSSELTAVSTVDPIKVYFPISEQEYLWAMSKRLAEGDDALKAAHTTNNLELVLANGQRYPHPGRIVLADRQVNIRTGTILLAGLFPNSQHVLRPGQYARVRLVVQTLKDALLVPQRAVIETQGAYNLAVVDEQNKVSIRAVQVGDNSGSFTVIREGVRAGERVVVEGIQKARQGAVVNPQPYKMEADPAPAAGTNIPAP
ncbi:MAG: efflux RND transporter periplasmic adaptor subunit [Verrucomicrobia bacterium]|nr:efflux RND transporter periplasmic adaptor subunit [Verrucomicrobiota bacterium]MCG2680781.1 efflux RND transporter periplasmic adaptor subunit [Kiritimatiellia bacterium]MBU4246810.1 efflux RND transporter periplasmic adaptor subunit [Verrucomicrobiota bacterium]MBU4291031.1 efflux RND transporter periplasmic adaptor subunit [Verrucomicrobiota bacterium]MBU4429526.1 efflux RND transporter periplasmic adaptor subunit [Verrucomicrobiota bacterium]